MGWGFGIGGVGTMGCSMGCSSGSVVVVCSMVVVDIGMGSRRWVGVVDGSTLVE